MEFKMGRFFTALLPKKLFSLCPLDLSICDTNGEGPLLNSTPLTETAPNNGHLSLAHPIHNPTSLTAPNGLSSSSLLSCSPMTSSGPVSLIEEEDREFWSLMTDPGVSDSQMKRVMKKMQRQQQQQPTTQTPPTSSPFHHPLLDEQLSVSSSQSSHHTNGSGQRNPISTLSPLVSSGGLLGEKEQLDYAVTSLGRIPLHCITCFSCTHSKLVPLPQACSWICCSKKWS